MNTELQNKAWSLLPKEFKKEVKDNYQELMSALSYFESKTSLNCEECNRCDLIRGKQAVYNKFFGYHNLTSDSEGEVELLYVTRQKVMGLYANAKKLHDLYKSATCINTTESQQIDICTGTMNVLTNLFGSKCLPDDKENDCIKFTKTLDDALEVETADPLNEWINSRNVPKPAEPKLKVGQLAMFKGRKVEIIGYSDHYPQLYRVFVLTENYHTDVKESARRTRHRARRRLSQFSAINRKLR